MRQSYSSKKVIKLSHTRKRSKKLKIDQKILGLALLVAACIGVFLGLRPNAYQIIINGKEVGAIKDKQIIDEAKETVIAQLKGIYQANIKFEEDVTLKKYRAKKRDYIDPSYLVTYMRDNMNVLISFYQIEVEGKAIGIVASSKDLEELKERLKQEYYGDTESKVDFAKKVELKPIFAKESELTKMDLLVERCTATSSKIVEYKVEPGDSLSGIADRLKTSTEEITNKQGEPLNDSVVRIGETLKAKVYEPLLPLAINEESKPAK